MTGRTLAHPPLIPHPAGYNNSAYPNTRPVLPPFPPPSHTISRSQSRNAGGEPAAVGPYGQPVMTMSLQPPQSGLRTQPQPASSGMFVGGMQDPHHYQQHQPRLPSPAGDLLEPLTAPPPFMASTCECPDARLRACVRACVCCMCARALAGMHVGCAMVGWAVGGCTLLKTVN